LLCFVPRNRALLAMTGFLLIHCMKS